MGPSSLGNNNSLRQMSPNSMGKHGSSRYFGPKFPKEILLSMTTNGPKTWLPMANGPKFPEET